MKTVLCFFLCSVSSVFSHTYWGLSDKEASSGSNPENASELMLTLEQNIANCPYPITEGYMTEGQKEQYNSRLRSYGPIRSILEVGLNAGHSAENFFQQCKDLQTFLSVDICYHPYTPYAIKYFEAKYKDRFVPYIGDSLVKIPEYADLYPNKKFDLIFIDGNHSYEYCLGDIFNGRKVAHEKTHLWVDDYNDNNVASAVKTALEMGIIEIEAIHEDTDANRSWVEAHYLL